MRITNHTLDYIAATFATEDETQRAAAERLRAHNAKVFGMQLGATEGRLLQWILHMHEVHSVVEIGSLAGYSALWIAKGMKAGGEIHCIERDDGHFELLRKTAIDYETATSKKVEIHPHHGAAFDILPTLEPLAPFDAVFIDADKLNYAKYLDWAESHTRKGGLIIGDNTLLFGWAQSETPPPKGEGNPSPSAWKAMREFNQRLADPERYDATLIPTQEGMTVARKLF